MKALIFIKGFFMTTILHSQLVNSNHYLEVYLMGSFQNDSIIIKTKRNNNFSGRLKTDLSTGQAMSFRFLMKKDDSVIFIKDLINKTYDSVKYNSLYPYLYIYYDRPKFKFNYSKKILLLE